MKDDYAVVKRLKSGESLPSGSVPVDFVRDSSGDIHASTAAGPKKMVTEENINTVLASAGGTGAKTSTIHHGDITNLAITEALHNGAEIHLESTGNLTILDTDVTTDTFGFTVINTDSGATRTITPTGFAGVFLRNGSANVDLGNIAFDIKDNEKYGFTVTLNGTSRYLNIEDFNPPDALVSGTTIKTVNGASLLGPGDVAVDLPGGVTATAFDDGLNSGNAVVDRSSAVGETILTYLTAGASTFTPPANVTSVRVLAVAGGGSGGNNHAGGGGAGEYYHNAAFAVVPGTVYNVVIGAGGAAQAINSNAGNDGGDTTFGSVVLNGGGGGGGRDAGQGGRAGGSGGGGAGGTATEATPGASVKTGGGLGNAGGSGFTTGGLTGGGGGGSAGVGANGTTSPSGTGGSGTVNNILGISVNYAAGGTGGAYSGVSVPGATQDGAGAGAATGNGGNAAANRGSGGGGGGSAFGDGGAGSAGIVAVRFVTQTRSYKALQTYADNTSALAGGILAGQFFKVTSTGAVAQAV